jgi:hypothetical protein
LKIYNGLWFASFFEKNVAFVFVQADVGKKLKCNQFKTEICIVEWYEGLQMFVVVAANLFFYFTFTDIY